MPTLDHMLFYMSTFFYMYILCTILWVGVWVCVSGWVGDIDIISPHTRGKWRGERFRRWRGEGDTSAKTMEGGRVWERRKGKTKPRQKKEKTFFLSWLCNPFLRGGFLFGVLNHFRGCTFPPPKKKAGGGEKFMKGFAFRWGAKNQDRSLWSFC